ncbi:MAG: hypothetical protein JRH12_11115 [Deltaproteobacteria bacterium]|nr:hypothetical protein [Deltaproteobacteria bacterium]MBW2478693.1 hypothetical protein [Deltaproteobacteria bacterium]
MKVFFGAAIQGASNREERAAVHRLIIDALKSNGCEVISEHTTGKDYDATVGLLQGKLGPLPPKGMERTILIRNKMIEFIEGDIDAAFFEVSTPSLGTGIEFAHAYLRPRLGLPEIPVVALYQNGHWPNDLSTMIKGITGDVASCFRLHRYDDPRLAQDFIKEIVEDIRAA